MNIRNILNRALGLVTIPQLQRVVNYFFNTEAIFKGTVDFTDATVTLPAGAGGIYGGGGTVSTGAEALFSLDESDVTLSNNSGITYPGLDFGDTPFVGMSSAGEYLGFTEFEGEPRAILSKISGVIEYITLPGVMRTQKIEDEALEVKAEVEVSPSGVRIGTIGGYGEVGQHIIKKTGSTALQWGTHSWTTAARPTPEVGQFPQGFNTTTSKFEGWNGTTWVDFH